MYDKSIIAYKVTPRIDLELVLDTVKLATCKVPKYQRGKFILHSDQGWHFTTPTYQNLLKENNITQSISARGSSVDNVPIESFFSALKAECIYLDTNLKYKDIDTKIDNYIDYYNNERLQEKIKELTPLEYRELTPDCVFF